MFLLVQTATCGRPPSLRTDVAKRLVLTGLAFLFSSYCAFAETNQVFSGLVSFQFQAPLVVASVASYQASESTLIAPAVACSRAEGVRVAPQVGYQRGEWLGSSDAGPFCSALVGYYYQIVADSVGDGIPDLWRARYFGGYGTTTNELSCATGDASGTGQNNYFKYIAGLDPTNPASVFAVGIERSQEHEGEVRILFSPRWPDRSYTTLYTTNLLGDVWFPVAPVSTIDSNVSRIVTDGMVGDPCRFYRIGISYP